MSYTHKEAGEPCKKCGVPIEKRKTKAKAKAGQLYRYEWLLRCPGCNTIYMVDEAKVWLDAVSAKSAAKREAKKKAPKKPKKKRRKKDNSAQLNRDARSLCAERVKGLIERATKPEMAFRAKLYSLGIKHQFQKPFITGTAFRIVDFYIHKWRLIIEIDGGYHLDEKQMRSDDARSSWLIKNHDCRIVRFTNEEALTMDRMDILKQLT